MRQIIFGRWLKTAALVVSPFTLACGCKSLTSSHIPASGAESKIEMRNNAASLLHDLLGDEKNVDKVLIVKSADAPVKALIKLISATAAAQDLELLQMATNDPSLNLQVTALPPGEKAAREATAHSKEHDLLFTSGANFAFNLLMTQAEAQNYGWHLAVVAADKSTNAAEARTFSAIGRTMRELDDQALQQIRALPPPAR